jgi:cytochrome c oxidase assembly protein subunit 11
MDVQVGMPSEASYVVENLEPAGVYGRAVYNVSPPEAGLYFVKTECFCFTSQLLAGGEQKNMPVRFYIDPDIPDTVSELTLSYTFFLDQDTPGVAGLSPEKKQVN